MDDSLKALEERLEQLVPKGLSDLGRERMENQIDDLAGTLENDSTSGGWKWGIGVAAAVVAMVLALWSPESALRTVAVVDPDEAVTPVPVAVLPGRTEADLFAILTLTSSRQLETRTDRGWATEPGAEMPHRYWSYQVTDEEELMDDASGYAVRVVSQHEEWVPVAVTSL